eukprot:1156980-Pelagomonas_calceolata.AAC.6
MAGYFTSMYLLSAGAGKGKLPDDITHPGSHPYLARSDRIRQGQGPHSEGGEGQAAYEIIKLFGLQPGGQKEQRASLE